MASDPGVKKLWSIVGAIGGVALIIFVWVGWSIASQHCYSTSGSWISIIFRSFAC